MAKPVSPKVSLPGVYVPVVPGDNHTIGGVSTSWTAFVGTAADGPMDEAVQLDSMADFEGQFGGVSAIHPASRSIQDFFSNGGGVAFMVRVAVGTSASILGSAEGQTGMYALDKIERFNLLVIPPFSVSPRPATQAAWNASFGGMYQAALNYCVARRAILLLDAPAFWATSLAAGNLANEVAVLRPAPGAVGSANGAVYFPWLESADGTARPPSGAVAGVAARTDRQRGVWRPPAGTEAGLRDVDGLQVDLTDDQAGPLNAAGINCLRALPPYGPVVWGARTLDGATALQSDWQYLNVRRLFLYIEASLRAGTGWAVFERNGPALWASLEAAVTAFMDSLLGQGAFYSFEVTCDATTNTQQDIEQGLVNVVVQFAPVKPAEFVVLYFQQVAQAP